MSQSTTRRRFLQAAGVTGVTAIAGCTIGGVPRDDVSVSRADLGPESLSATKSVDVDRVAADPRDVPAPIDRNEPATVEVEMVTKEVVAEVEDGVTFTYMTFDGQIPGPMVRTRVGDTVDLTIRNDESNSMAHNVDFHACRGPGGGAETTMVAPGETEHLRFKVTYPGAFVYHCAVANVDYHISAGMFGLIVVEPEEGLPAVDHEFYLGQHELYTKGAAGEEGHHDFDFESMAAEDPTYVLMNGEKYAITPDTHDEMNVETGDTARVFYAVGGPNLTSSVHAIGSVWDEVWAEGALANDPQRYVQTLPVAPGSACVATMSFPVPGDFKLVDHALSRVARKGAIAVVRATGPADEEVFDPDPN
jgi:nitrite reductase (NO-forming)